MKCYEIKEYLKSMDYLLELLRDQFPRKTKM